MNQKQIYNIFCKKKVAQKLVKLPLIIIDDREKNSLVASELINKNLNIKFERLEIGDYIINEIVIERKTIEDFINSMINKRLQNQLVELKKYPKQLLLIEGFDFDYNNFDNKNALRGFLTSILLEFCIPIIYTRDEQETSEFLYLIAKKQQKSRKEIALRPSKTAKTIEEQKQFILEGFDGIGPATAKKLIEKFKTLNKIFNASEEELESIERFTKEKIKKFKKIIEY